MTTAPIPLVPLNDLALLATLKAIDPTTGKSVPLTTGAVSAFIATTNTSTATPADATLTASGTHIGNGKWLISFDAAALTSALLASLFTNQTPYLIIQQTGGFRRYVQLVYSDAEAAT